MTSRARFFLTFLVLFLGMSCSGGAGSGPGPGGGPPGGKGEKGGPVPVSVAAADSATHTPSISLGATLEPWNTGVVSAEVPGRIIRLEVDLGDRVRKGERLAEIAPEELAWAAEKAEAEAVLAESTLKRTEQLLAVASATEEDLDQARATASRARADARIAAKRHRDATIRAPWDGWVSQRLVSVGDLVQQGRALFHFTAISPLRVSVDVPEQYAGVVGNGSEIEVVPRPGTAPVRLTILRTGPVVSAASRTYRVEAELPNPEGIYKAGAYCSVTLLTGPPIAAAAVPESAVAVTGGVSQVFVIAGGEVAARKVDVLERNGDRVVVGGVSAGDRVAVTGVQRLFPGARVEDLSSGTGAPVPGDGSEPGKGRP